MVHDSTNISVKQWSWFEFRHGHILLHAKVGRLIRNS